MAANPFKAFIAFSVTDPNFKKPIDAWEADDPSGGQWRTIGLGVPIKGEELVVDLQGAGKLMAVQFNERILPGKVRDEALAKEVKKVEDANGRKISKKDYAVLRGEVEFALLPKAFIRRTSVPVIFSKGFMLVCTTSQRRADEVVSVLMAAFGDTFKPNQVIPANPVLGVLTTLARENAHDLDDLSFYAGDSAVLKGEEKRTVRIKDKEVSDSDVQTFLREAYEVQELGVEMHEDGEIKTAFVVNTNLTFKRIEIVGVKPGKAEDFFQFALLCAQAHVRMLKGFIEVCGGMQPVPTSAADEDDEL